MRIIFILFFYFDGSGNYAEVVWGGSDTFKKKINNNNLHTVAATPGPPLKHCATLTTPKLTLTWSWL